jgi:Glycosyltransferase family 87
MNNALPQMAADGVSEQAPQVRRAERGRRFWPRELLVALLPVLVVLEILAWFAYFPVGLRGVADFRSLYTSGYMARTGHAAQLYDHDTVQQFENELVPVGRTLNLAMDHPAYEEVIFAPLSVLPYRAAFIVFIIVNLGVVVLCVRLLAPSFRVLSERWKGLPALLFAAYFPITKAINSGQDSIILLALLAATFVYSQRRRDLHAGLLTGLGLFKFQIVIPIALLFFLWKRWRFVMGFAISSAVAGLVSLLWVGVNGTRQYVSMLLGMSLNLKSAADGARYELSPQSMLNLRGLFSAIGEGRVSHWWLQGLIAAASVAVLLLAARRRPSLPLAIVAASLVSYHFNSQDASILMIPLGLCLCGGSVWAALAGLLTLIIPFTAIIPWCGFLTAIPALALLFATAQTPGRFSVENESRETSACAV